MVFATSQEELDQCKLGWAQSLVPYCEKFPLVLVSDALQAWENMIQAVNQISAITPLLKDGSLPKEQWNDIHGFYSQRFEELKELAEEEKMDPEKDLVPSYITCCKHFGNPESTEFDKLQAVRIWIVIASTHKNDPETQRLLSSIPLDQSLERLAQINPKSIKGKGIIEKQLRTLCDLCQEYKLKSKPQASV